MTDLSASKVDEFLDSLNEAMEIHAQNAIKGLPYNKTELAEVVDITRRDQGWYTVWNGAIRYLASSENTTYTIGTKVYVNIPNNDFSNQKTIIGLYTENTEQAIYFKSPLDNYEPCTGNILEDNNVGEKLNGFNNEMSLLANWNISEEFANEEKTSASLTPKPQTIVLYETTSAMSNTRDYDGFKYISISAYFKTLLKELGAISGNYGLRVVLFGTKVFDETKDAVAVERSYALDNTAMVGDLYNFSVYYKQEGLFNIEEFDKIDKLRLEFFQEGNFTTSGENAPIPYKYSMNSESGPYQLINNNIFVKDIAIKFGNDPTGNRDTVRILTVNGLTYDSALDDRMNRKTIELDWVHLDPDTEERVKISNISDARKISDLNNYRIHWYRDSKYTQADLIYQMDQAAEATDQKRQVYNDWKQIEQNSTATQEEKFKLRKLLVSTFNLVEGTDYTGNLDNSFSLLDSPGKARIENALSSKINQTIASDNLAGAFWIAKLNDSTYKNWTWSGFQPDTTQETNKVKVVIEYGPMVNDDVFDTSSENYHRVESNELVFNNLREVLVEDKNSEFLINYSDNSNGNYPIYDGVTGNILSRHEVSKERVLTAVLTKKGKSYFNGNEIIIWKIPKTNSMIYVPDNYFSDSLLTYNIDKEEKTNQEKNDIALIDQYKDNLITSGVNITKNTTNLDILNNYYKIIKNDFNNYYFVKRIGTPGTAVNAEQSYNIKQFYNKAAVNNTVFCYVIKNNQVFTTSVTMTFSQHGTCGTDYTFTLGLGPKVDSNWNVVGPSDTALTLGDSYYHEILFNLYNSKNEEIELTDEEKNAIIKAWVNKESKGYYSGLNKATSSAEKNAAEYLDFLTQSKNSKFIRVAVRAQDHSPIGDLRYIVLQASIRENVDTDNLGNITFTQLLPIHIRAKGTSWVLNGSDYIIYDDKGTNPSFYNDTYSARQGNEIANHISITKTDSNDNFYPKIDSATNKIVPTPLYINDITENIGIVIRDDNNKVVYMCPLVILQNKYQIPAINSWNGQLKIDTNNNEVLASMIGAGHKNRTGNTFSGVLMGDVGVRNGSSVNKTTGLFGYNKGVRTFELNIDGKAYIGASGNGRIYIDGDTGTIKSAAREASNTKGTEFNLKENYIDVRSSDNNKARIHLDVTTNNDTGAYFTIYNKDEKDLIKIADNSYYLQTANYIEENLDADPKIKGKGLKLDLANGTLNSYNKVTINGAIGSSINFGSGSSINLGNGSSLNSTGKLIITGDSNSSITFGKTFNVDGNGTVTLGNLNFVNNNGNILTAQGHNLDGDIITLNASNIKPQWMTFVTDINGTITKGKTSVTVDDVTCYVDVVDTTVTNTYSYRVDSTTELVYSPITITFANKSNEPVYVNDEVTGPLNPSPDGTLDWYNHTVTVDSYKQGQTIVSDPYLVSSSSIPTTTTRTAKGTGTGHTDVPVVTNIILKVKKISMWALTNDSVIEEEKTIE